MSTLHAIALQWYVPSPSTGVERLVQWSEGPKTHAMEGRCVRVYVPKSAIQPELSIFAADGTEVRTGKAPIVNKE